MDEGGKNENEKDSKTGYIRPLEFPAEKTYAGAHPLLNLPAHQLMNHPAHQLLNPLPLNLAQTLLKKALKISFKTLRVRA